MNGQQISDLVNQLRTRAKLNRGSLQVVSLVPGLNLGAMLTTNSQIARLILYSDCGICPALADWQIVCLFWGFPDLKCERIPYNGGISLSATWSKDKPPADRYQRYSEVIRDRVRQADQLFASAKMATGDEAESIRDQAIKVFDEIIEGLQ